LTASSCLLKVVTRQKGGQIQRNFQKIYGSNLPRFTQPYMGGQRISEKISQNEH